MKRNISRTATDEVSVVARENVLRELVDQVDLRIFNRRFYHDQWVFFRPLRKWLRKYDQLFQNIYSDVTISLALYLLQQCWSTGVPFMTEKVRALVSISVSEQWRHAFTHDVLKFAITVDRAMFEIIHPLLKSNLKNISLEPYIQTAVRRQPHLRPCSSARAILAKVVGTRGPKTEDHCQLLGKAVLLAQHAGESEVSTIIIHRLQQCSRLCDLQGLFMDVYGTKFELKNRHSYTFTKERMNAVKQQAEYELLWQHRCQKRTWKLLYALYKFSFRVSVHLRLGRATRKLL
ncbi:hypothetical protein PSPO01_10229 [Paraphaeosphaeria sporulosa]